LRVERCEFRARIGKIALLQPRVSIERGLDGKFNFENPETAGGTIPALNLVRISVADGTLLYTDKQSGEGFEAGHCRLDVDHLRYPGGKSQDLVKHLSIKAEIACGEIRNHDITLSDLKFTVNGKSAAIDLEPVTMRVFGGQGAGSIQADYSGAVPLYRVQYKLSQFNIEEFFMVLLPQKVAEGPMDFSATLSMQGRTANDLKQTAGGEFTLRGENLTLNGRDLDREVSRYESSQNFSLVDVGAFFFAGPVGLAVTKGYDFASIFQGSGGRTEIRTLVSDWKVEHGVAQARDVAMATNKNRLALQGGIDFVNQRFNHVTVALIDSKGCAKARQKIRGSFQKPVVESPNILKSLTGPALTLLKKGRELLPDGDCKVFYAGSVTPPK
jgi:AsmA protein